MAFLGRRQTWTRLSGHGLPTGYMGRSAVAIAPSDSRRIYAVIEAKGGILWRSDDGGTNWTMVSANTLVDQRPFYFTHFNVDPKDENHVYAVSEQLAESKDGGRTFKAIAPDVHVDYHAMWIAPNDPNRMMTGEDGGYALTLDGGKNWMFSRNVPIGRSVSRRPLGARKPVLGLRSAAGQQRLLRSEQLEKSRRHPRRKLAERHRRRRHVGGSRSGQSESYFDRSANRTHRGLRQDHANQPLRRSRTSTSTGTIFSSSRASTGSIGIRRSRLLRGTRTCCGSAATSCFNRAIAACTGARSAPI